MLRSNFTTKKTVNAYIMMFVIFMILVIAIFLMIKYQVEGEKNLPFEISNIKVLSTATSNTLENQGNNWTVNLIQNNDIYITINKNANYKKEEVISTISFNNFNIIKQSEKGNTNVYRANPETSKYLYKEEYILTDINYKGSNTTDIGLLNINNQGGTIGFSIATTDLGEFLINQNEKIQVDGTILNKGGITQEDIKFAVSFDMVIETESNHKFQTTIKLELPKGNILEDGISKTEDLDLKQVIFKRI